MYSIYFQIIADNVFKVGQNYPSTPELYHFFIPYEKEIHSNRIEGTAHCTVHIVH